MVPGVPKGRLGRPGFLFCVAVISVTAAACSGEAPAQVRPGAAPPAPAPAVEPSPQSDTIKRADALLEDFRRREAAQAKYDRENPPPKFIPIPRSLVLASQAESAAAAADTRPSNASAEPVAAPAAPAATAPPTPARDATWWKSQMQSLQAALDAELAKLAVMDKANLKYGYNDAQAQYKAQAAAVANARQAIDRLRDEARRAGVPPGWLR